MAESQVDWFGRHASSRTLAREVRGMSLVAIAMLLLLSISDSWWLRAPVALLLLAAIGQINLHVGALMSRAKDVPAEGANRDAANADPVV